MRLLVALAFLASAVCSAQETSSQLAEVVVTGEQPGPKLWKLTKSGHTLWILATVTPKPRDIIWKSAEIANVLDDTQEVVDQQLQGRPFVAGIDFDLKSMNPFARLNAYRKAAKAMEKVERPRPLNEVVPAEAYARFTKLKSIYLPADKEIEMQPAAVAGSRLLGAAVSAKTLTARALTHEEVHRLARRRGIKVSEITKEIKVDVETMIQIQADFMQEPTDELACFLSTLDRIEKNLSSAIENANAWAKGDVQKLKSIRDTDGDACRSAYLDTQRWAQLDSELDIFWLEAIEAKVAKNKSTLVLLNIAELIEPDGVLHQLANRGFSVEEPQ